MDFDLLMLLKVTTTILLLPKQVRCMLTKVNVPDTYQKSFDIFVDSDHADWKTIKNALSTVNEHIKFVNTKCEDLSLTIDEIKEYAAVQAQDVHYPKERYLLESADWKEGHKGSYKMYICFVQGYKYWYC